MIQKIGINLNFRNNSINKNNKSVQNTNTVSSQNSNPIDATIPNADMLKSYYVSFAGKRKNGSNKNSFDERKINSTNNGQEKYDIIESNLSYHGEKLLNDSKQVAKKYGHSEITQLHVLRAGLENIKIFLDKLNTGEISYDDESSFSTYEILEQDLGRNVIKDKEKRDIILPIIAEEIQVLDKKLAEQPKTTSQQFKKEPDFAKDFLNFSKQEIKNKNKEFKKWAREYFSIFLNN